MVYSLFWVMQDVYCMINRMTLESPNSNLELQKGKSQTSEMLGIGFRALHSSTNSTQKN